MTLWKYFTPNKYFHLICFLNQYSLKLHDMLWQSIADKNRTWVILTLVMFFSYTFDNFVLVCVCVCVCVWVCGCLGGLVCVGGVNRGREREMETEADYIFVFLIVSVLTGRSRL